MGSFCFMLVEICCDNCVVMVVVWVCINCMVDILCFVSMSVVVIVGFVLIVYNFGMLVGWKWFVVLGDFVCVDLVGLLGSCKLVDFVVSYVGNCFIGSVKVVVDCLLIDMLYLVEDMLSYLVDFGGVYLVMWNFELIVGVCYCLDCECFVWVDDNCCDS